MADQHFAAPDKSGMLDYAKQLVHVPTAPVLMALFMMTLALPVSVSLAGLRLSPTRIYLLIAFIPLLMHLLSGKVGKLIAPDIFMMLFCFWTFITFMYHDGTARFAYSIMNIVELLGGYMVGRCLIRSAVDFRYMFKAHLLVLMVLFPFALIDFATNNEIWARAMDTFGDTVYRSESSQPRYGFQRVMTGFEHPILFGIFCSIAVGNAAYIMHGKIIKGSLWVGFSTFMTLMSLSSGALLSAVMQSGLIIWGWLTKAKWKLLLAILAVLTITLEFASNRGPVIIFIETLTFNSNTAWTRVIQWEYGGAEVLRNPIFGKGLTGDWIRPAWLYTSSIDAYWLVIAFRHGLPGIAFLLAAFGMTVWRALKAQNLSQEAAHMRTGYLITMTGVFFSLVTVHIWGGLSIFVYTYLGAGLWFLSDTAQKIDTDHLAVQTTKPVSRFSRSTKIHQRGQAASSSTMAQGGSKPIAPTTRHAKYLKATEARKKKLQHTRKRHEAPSDPSPAINYTRTPRDQ